MLFGTYRDSIYRKGDIVILYLENCAENYFFATCDSYINKFKDF